MADWRPRTDEIKSFAAARKPVRADDPADTARQPQASGLPGIRAKPRTPSSLARRKAVKHLPSGRSGGGPAPEPPAAGQGHQTFLPAFWKASRPGLIISCATDWLSFCMSLAWSVAISTCLRT
jgi:hypothetical protein